MTFYEWMQWEKEIHEKPDQIKRLTSAKSSKTTPSLVCKDSLSGMFPGSGANPYSTTLASCTCGDFLRRHLPCKHMYRLAIELGVLDEVAQSGVNKNTYMASQFTLSQAVAELENLTDSAQYFIKDFLYQSLYHDVKELACPVQENDSCLLQCPLLEATDSSQEALKYFKRNQIIQILDDHGITGFKRNMKHEALIEWCIENIPDLWEVFPKVYVFRFSAYFQTARRKVYTYLLRKYDWDAYYDGNMNRIEYPHGAKFEDYISTYRYSSDGFVRIDQSGNPNMCYFPDDEITALLTLYGHNRCLNGFLAIPQEE